MTLFGIPPQNGVPQAPCLSQARAGANWPEAAYLGRRAVTGVGGAGHGQDASQPTADHLNRMGTETIST
ncbi:MAG TPA: hypothetical protein VF459_14990 [Caulobacteraceae bacterium]